MQNIINCYDHILLLDKYPKPQLHKHLTKHIIFCLNGDMELIVENNNINCSGICINSNVVHTIKSSYNQLADSI